MRSEFNLNRETTFVAKASAFVCVSAMIAVLVSMIACGSTERAPLVFAAASLVDVMEELRVAYEEETGANVRFNFAGSNLIANQIITGAPANGVIVAGWSPIDKLVSANKIANGGAAAVISNQLVVVRPSGADRLHDSIEGLVGDGRIAMPDSDTAPAGEYFEAVLRERGLWEELEPQIIPALDARAALAAAATGNVAYALVYETDAVSTDAVEIAFAIESSSDATVPRYYAAPLLGDDEAIAFIEFLATPQAIAIFESHGFRR